MKGSSTYLINSHQDHFKHHYKWLVNFPSLVASIDLEWELSDYLSMASRWTRQHCGVRVINFTLICRVNWLSTRACPFSWPSSLRVYAAAPRLVRPQGIFKAEAEKKKVRGTLVKAALVKSFYLAEELGVAPSPALFINISVCGSERVLCGFCTPQRSVQVSAVPFCSTRGLRASKVLLINICQDIWKLQMHITQSSPATLFIYMQMSPERVGESSFISSGV